MSGENCRMARAWVMYAENDSFLGSTRSSRENRLSFVKKYWYICVGSEKNHVALFSAIWVCLLRHICASDESPSSAQIRFAKSTSYIQDAVNSKSFSSAIL